MNALAPSGKQGETEVSMANRTDPCLFFGLLTRAGARGIPRFGRKPPVACFFTPSPPVFSPPFPVRRRDGDPAPAAGEGRELPPRTRQDLRGFRQV